MSDISRGDSKRARAIHLPTLDDQLPLPYDILYSLIYTFDVDVIRFSHVCRSWRRLAISTPKAWSKIIFDSSRYPTHSITDRVQTFIDRSKETALVVDMTITSYDTKGAGETVGDFFKLVKQSSDRWAELHLSLDNGCFPNVTRHLEHVTAPHLTALSIAWSHDPSQDRSPIDTKFFQDCLPRLVALKIFGSHSEPIFDLIQDQQSFASLQVLSLSPCSSNQLLSLSQLPQLECLSLIHGNLVRDVLRMDKHIRCPKLKHLYLHGLYLDAIDILAHLHAPNLLSLYLLDVNISSSPESIKQLRIAEEIPTFASVVLLRLASSMQYYSCYREQPDSGSRSPLAFLSKFPNTRHLLFDYGYLSYMVIPFLNASPPPAQEVVLPHLRTVISTLKDIPRHHSWRKGIRFNPTREEIHLEVLSKGSVEAGWLFDERFPPDPRCAGNERFWSKETYKLIYGE